jgi:hypothetical protein
MSKQYKLTLSEAQAKIVGKACEFYARIGYGQYSEILWNFMDFTADDAHERRDEAERLLFEARAQIYPDLGKMRGASYGIGRNDELDRSYDVYQVLRYAFEKENDKLTFRHEPFTLLNEEFAMVEVEET